MPKHLPITTNVSCAPTRVSHLPTAALSRMEAGACEASSGLCWNHSARPWVLTLSSVVPSVTIPILCTQAFSTQDTAQLIRFLFTNLQSFSSPSFPEITHGSPWQDFWESTSSSVIHSQGISWFIYTQGRSTSYMVNFTNKLSESSPVLGRRNFSAISLLHSKSGGWMNFVLAWYYFCYVFVHCIHAYILFFLFPLVSFFLFPTFNFRGTCVGCGSLLHR